VWKGDLKATQQNKLHLQENIMRIDLEANQDPSGIYFEMRLREPRSQKESVKIMKEFEKNQLREPRR
jgi:hypothetical protein